MTRHRSPLRGFAPFLLALALLVRLAVPAGWMPAGDGATIVPCAGSGPLRIGGAMAHHGHHGSKPRDQAADHRCPFHVAAAAVTLPEPAASPQLAPVRAMAVQRLAPSLVPGRGLAAPPPPPTGPPTLA